MDVNEAALGITLNLVDSLKESLKKSQAELAVLRDDADHCRACAAPKLGEHHPDCEFNQMKRAMLEVIDQVTRVIKLKEAAEAKLKVAREAWNRAKAKLFSDPFTESLVGDAVEIMSETLSSLDEVSHE